MGIWSRSLAISVSTLMTPADMQVIALLIAAGLRGSREATLIVADHNPAQTVPDGWLRAVGE